MSTNNIYLRKIHSTGSLGWCMLHCSGTPCRLNCMLSSSVSLSPVAGKSERATLDWVWPKYSTQLEFFSTSERQNRTNMGIPANEKCMLLRVGANKEVVLTWIMWSVSSKSGRSQRREREREGKEDENGSVVSIYLFVFTLISLHSCHCVSLSYRGCVQVKLQICGRRSGLESSVPRSQLT